MIRSLALTVLVWEAAIGQSVRQAPTAGGPAPAIRVARSEDGLTFRDEGAIQAADLAAPGLVCLANGQLVAVFDRAAGPEGSRTMLVVSRSRDNGRSWSDPRPIHLNWPGSPPDRWMHGELLTTPEGLVQLCFLATGGIAAPDRAPTVVATRVFRAITRDGMSYRLDDAVNIPVEGSPPYLAMVRVGGETHLFISSGTADGNAEHQVSADGRTFRPASPQDSPGIENLRSIVPVDGGYRAYLAADDGVRSLFSRDARSWSKERGVRLAGRWDPAVVRLQDGSFLMLYGPRLDDERPQSGGPGALAAVVGTLLMGKDPTVLHDRATSIKKLHRLGLHCLMYAEDHGGNLPPDLASLVDGGRVKAEDLVSPFEEDPNAMSYIYIEGQRHTMDPRNVVAYEKLENQGGEGTVVLFLDGHVKWMKAEAFEKDLADTLDRLGR
ncbi:MAG: exo-alpha-sialidase [Planctomycetes bacterium]|nr:exo-alpha-sialidase [Planctomycetota bacterium]